MKTVVGSRTLNGLTSIVVISLMIAGYGFSSYEAIKTLYNTAHKTDESGGIAYQFYTPAEFDSVSEVIIRWPVGWSGVERTWEEIVVNVVDTSRLNIVVSDYSDMEYVESKLAYMGIPLANVTFTIQDTDTVWIRDYGPQFVCDKDHRGYVIDWKYSTTRRSDESFPADYSSTYNLEYLEKDLKFDGGNFMTDGRGVGFSTSALFEWNYEKTREEVEQMIMNTYGLKAFYTVPPLVNEGTGHIDMFAKLVDGDTILVGKYSDRSDPNYQVLEDIANYLSKLTASNGNKYEIIRIPMLSDFRTYTNALIVNDKVLVPQYGEPEDKVSLQIFKSAMPSYKIIGIDCTEVIKYGGAIHCITITTPTTVMKGAQGFYVTRTEMSGW